MSKLAGNRPCVLAPEHPAYGGSWPKATPFLRGRPRPAMQVQKTCRDRGLVREGANPNKALELNEELVAFLDESNPCSRECHVESTASGEWLSFAALFVGTLKGSQQNLSAKSRGHLRSYAPGFVHVSKRLDTAVAALHDDVKTFYRQLDPSVTATPTNSRCDCCGAETHRRKFYLDPIEVQHRRTKIRSSKSLGRAFRRCRRRQIVLHRDALDALEKRRGAAGRPRHLILSLQ